MTLLSVDVQHTGATRRTQHSQLATMTRSRCSTWQFHSSTVLSLPYVVLCQTLLRQWFPQGVLVMPLHGHVCGTFDRSLAANQEKPEKW